MEVFTEWTLKKVLVATAVPTPRATSPLQVTRQQWPLLLGRCPSSLWSPRAKGGVETGCLDPLQPLSH